MKPEDKSSIMGAVLLLVICVGGYIVMPSIMLWVGEYSTVAAGAVAALFIALPFIILYFRSRVQKRRDAEKESQL